MGLFDKLKKDKQPASGASCPHCNTLLDPMPQRKKKCPSCGNDIYVRTDPFKRVKILINYEDALSIDALSTLGFTEKEYRAVAGELTRKFGEAPSICDVVWGILNNHLVTAMQRKDWQNMRMLYWQQARILYEEGRDFFRILQEAQRCELRRYQSQDVKCRVEVLANAGCEKCISLNGKIFTIQEALETMPIPVKDCDNIFCRCGYLPVIDSLTTQ